jgi:ATP-binding cassette subfamily C exporter for protease/lipase
MKRPQPKPQKEHLLTLALREGRSAFLAAALFSLVTNLLFLALPIYTSQVFTRVLSSGSEATLLVLTFGTIAVFMVSSIIDGLRARVLANFGVVFDQRVSSHVFSALFDSVVQREPQAGAQALRDLDSFRQTMTGSGILALFDLPWSPIYLALLFWVDPIVGFVTLGSGVVLLILAFLQDRTTRPVLKSANNAVIRSYTFTEAGLRNSEVVRAMGMLPHVGQKWAKHRLDGMSQQVEASRFNDVWTSSIRFVRMLAQVAIIAAGAWLIIEGKIGAGLLFANMILSSRALAPIERGVASWTALVTAGQAFERLKALLTDYEPPKPGTTLPRPTGGLTVEGVSFAAPGAGRLLLSGVSFQLPAGEFLGVVGPSGAGKSTLVRLLVGVWPALNGSVRLSGSDVFAWSRTDFGQYIGYLPQDTELFSGSVRDNIARFIPGVTDEEVIRAAGAAGVHEMIVRLPNGYDTELGAGGVTLSVGQRQRIGLARAMLRDPAFIVLDEPNANLDAQGEEALLAAFKEMRARGTTLVVVSHKPSLLASADKLLVLREGKVDMFGPRDVVMAKLAKPNVRTITNPAQAAAEIQRRLEAKS